MFNFGFIERLENMEFIGGVAAGMFIMCIIVAQLEKRIRNNNYFIKYNDMYQMNMNLLTTIKKSGKIESYLRRVKKIL